MARKAIVDRNIVLKSLREGKTSQGIATQFGVSRQAIDLYRKEFIRTGLMHGTNVPQPVKTPPETSVPQPATAALPQNTSLDQMIELLIKAFSALKRIPELEAEAERYRHDYEGLLQQIEELEQNEKKRKEQEARWVQSQHSGTITVPQAGFPPPQE
jgi:hypothetical protein